jgi:ABC-type glycerol-3-phosphate transport system substrate-binding protein
VLTLFQSIAQGRSRGTLPPEVMSFTSANAVWAALTAGDIEMASLPVYTYLSQRSSATQLAIAALPQIDGHEQTVAGIYTFVLLTADAERRAQALGLIDQLLAPEVHSAWARAAGWLPTRQAAFAAWPAEDKDLELLQALLEKAVALPGGPAFTELSKRLQLLLSGVMSGELSPEEAARAFQ